MRRIAKMLGLATVVVAILAVAITGAAFAAGGNTADNDCVPNFYNWDYNYESPGPHGNSTAIAAGGNATDSSNQGEECLYSDCVPNPYESPGPHGAQNGKVS